MSVRELLEKRKTIVLKEPLVKKLHSRGGLSYGDGERMIDAFLWSLRGLETCVPGAEISMVCKEMALVSFVDSLVRKGLVPPDESSKLETYGRTYL